MSYEIKQPFASPQAGYLVIHQSSRRLLAGVGHNPYRAWTFPLNTPRGLNVLQEFSFDHPFHNGIFVGQGRVMKDGQVSNFWAPMGDWRQPDNPVFQNIGELRYGESPQIQHDDHCVTFTYPSTVWYDAQQRPVLDEVRVIRISETDDGTCCDVRSSKTAAYGALTFEATKFGSIGARVQPQLLPLLGGQILAGDGDAMQRGLADEVANGKTCDYVAYENELPGVGRFGLCLIVLENSAAQHRRGPWFIRDYGMAMFNATMTESIELAANATWHCALRVVAYDGALTPARAQRWVSEYR